jgi:exopolysaccharide production protein ExoY
MALIILLRLIYGSPVLFRQKRVGRAGKLFTLFKFRTMQRDAESALTSNPELYREYVKNNYKLPLSEDVRVTRLGRFLRASSLDELPQLFNVLRGDMSLVGPRPVVPDEVEKFGAFAPLILSIRPGLTGLWQVSGRSLIGDYDDRVRLNAEYIRDGSIIRDFAIIAKTLRVIFRIKDAGWEREVPEAIEEISSGQALSINDGAAIGPQFDGKQSVADHHAGIYGLGPGYTSRPLWRGRAAVDFRSSYRPRNTRHTDSSG